MLGRSRVERCGAFWSLCGSLGKAADAWPFADLSRPRAAPLGCARLQLHQRRWLHHDPSPSSSSLQRETREGAGVPPSGNKSVAGPRLEWPADIVERARRELSKGSNDRISMLRDRHAGEVCLSEPSSFISSSEMQQQLQANDLRAFWRRLRRAISQPLSRAAAVADPSFGALQGAPRGTASAPIVYKRYMDGMTAAHHYPSRLLPSNQATKLPPLFFVTPFALQEDADPSAQTQELRLRERVLRATSPGKMLPKISLAERLYGRVSLLFLFDVGGQHSQLSDVASWVRRLESYSSFISSVYGPAFAYPAANAASPAPAAVAGGSLPLGLRLLHQQLPGFGLSADGRGPELASLQYICIDHAPFWLRSLALRNMESLTPAFRPLSPFHSFPHRLLRAARVQEGPQRDVGGPPLLGESPLGGPQGRREGALRLLAEEYEHLRSLICSSIPGSSLIGSFLGYSGRWGKEEVGAFKRKEREKFVSVLLIDKAARVRWHATGSPTEEAVLLLLSGLKTLLAENIHATTCVPGVHL